MSIPPAGMRGLTERYWQRCRAGPGRRSDSPVVEVMNVVNCYSLAYHTRALCSRI
jgi:hypothetical protein